MKILRFTAFQAIIELQKRAVFILREKVYLVANNYEA